VVLTAMGSVINKCITVAEILKRRVAGLHQWNQIKSIVLEVKHAPGR
jgi:DNA-binding protein